MTPEKTALMVDVATSTLIGMKAPDAILQQAAKVVAAANGNPGAEALRPLGEPYFSAVFKALILAERHTVYCSRCRRPCAEFSQLLIQRRGGRWTCADVNECSRRLRGFEDLLDDSLSWTKQYLGTFPQIDDAVEQRQDARARAGIDADPITHEDFDSSRNGRLR